MYIMSGTRSGGGPDEGDAGSWANETLPMSVRKDLLERELKKLGFRKGGTDSASSSKGVTQQQQQPLGEHPKADDSPGGHGE
jgi:hypothetical protein